MRLLGSELPGLMIVESAPTRDRRGYFHSLFDAGIFAAAGIDFEPRQTALSHNVAAHTLRGLHYQRSPARQSKLVRCLRGRLYDVAIDMRRDSPAFRRWLGMELVGGSDRALFIPDGFAHGFLTLEPATDVLYELSAGEVPGCAAGLRWNDPALAIAWPAAPQVINERDRGWPDWEA